jgi:drug/metabolite transporter (DMT)-like permease
MWSCVGVLVKFASQWVDSSIITFCRFFFGVLFLSAFILIKDKKLSVNFSYKWIWIGAIGKCMNYIFENLGVSMGYTYSQVLVYPASISFLVLITCFYFKEKISPRSWFAIGLCLLGMCFVSWNGKPLSFILKTNGFISLIFIISAFGSSIHYLSQKILIENLESGKMNLSAFLIATVITAVPLPFKEGFTGSFSASAAVSLVALGAITGISFYIYANSLKTVPFLTAVIISNSGVLFSLIWAKLFFNDPIAFIAVIGTVIFFIGIVILNLPKGLSIKRLITLQK